MKIIEITGKNYSGSYTKTRTASRAVIVKYDQILLTYEANIDQYMIPGGGLEENETPEACCIRETAEETGFLIEPASCVLEIDEYYQDSRFISYYFPAEIAGETEMHLTENEKMTGAGPVWAPVSQAMKIFSDHASYEGINEEKRGLYYREYRALQNIEKDKSNDERNS